MLLRGLLLTAFIIFTRVKGSPYTPECNQKLLENKDFVPDSAFSESSYEENFKGQYARESINDEQAWCPLNKNRTSHKEYVSIDLGRLSVIKMIMTRGRNAVGYFSAKNYFIKYKQEDKSDWKVYKNYSGSQQLIGLRDPLNEKFTSLDPPLIARWLRLYPYQTKNVKICLKLQLYGCINTNHVVEYQMIDGSKYLSGINSMRYKDTTYDGTLLKNDTLVGGIGKLSDRDIESNTAESPIVDGAMKFVGWDRDQLKKPFVSLIFRFETPRNFSALSVRVANHFDFNIRVFKLIEMTFGWGFDGSNIAWETGRQNDTIENDDRIRISRWKEIKINNHFGNFVKIDLHFASQWIVLSEIYFHSNQLTNNDVNLRYNLKTDTPVKHNTPDQLNKNVNFNFNTMPLAHLLGLICGILGIIILLGFLLLLYIHNRRKRNSPTKERVIQLKYPDDENLFLANENQYYSSKLNKGTIIPFNISPYKYCTTQRSNKNASSCTQGLLTPAHNIVNINSPKLVIKSSPIHNPYGIDRCIYTSLPASDSESMGTPDRKSNNFQQFLPSSVIQSYPIPPYWNNHSVRSSISPEKIFYNSNNIDDDSSYTFQCFKDSQMTNTNNNIGLIYTNQSNCQEYDSFKSPTLNDTDPDSESTINKYSSDLDLTIEDLITGCCGNSTIANSMKSNVIKNNDASIPNLRIDNLNDLTPLGIGRWGEIFIDISFPPEFEFQYNTQRGELNPSCDFNGWENRAALIKILNESAPFEIREMFYAEYSIGASVNHKNICRIIAANFEANILRPFIISEYSIHGNLYNYFQNICYGSKFNFFDLTLGFEGKPDISHQQTIMIIVQLAKALKYMEEMQLIHRDVACRNCLVFHVAEGELKIKLSDSAMSQAQFRNCYVRPKSIFKTFSLSHQPVHISSALLPLRWSAFESITDDQFSAKSDVYAFGISAWEIFTRCRTYPFSEMSDEQVILNAVNLVNKHISNSAILSLPSQCAKEMNDFIQQCVHPIPMNRPNFHDICIFLQNKVNRTV